MRLLTSTNCLSSKHIAIPDIAPVPLPASRMPFHMPFHVPFHLPFTSLEYQSHRVATIPLSIVGPSVSPFCLYVSTPARVAAIFVNTLQRNEITFSNKEMKNHGGTKVTQMTENLSRPLETPATRLIDSRYFARYGFHHVAGRKTLHSMHVMTLLGMR